MCSKSRHHCTICWKKRYSDKMIKVYVGLVREYRYYCSECLKSVENKNFVVEDRGIKKRVPLYDNYDSYFV